MRYQDGDVIDRSFRRLKHDVVFTLCAVVVILALLTLRIIKIV
jgi:hypothetical protein